MKKRIIISLLIASMVFTAFAFTGCKDSSGPVGDSVGGPLGKYDETMTVSFVYQNDGSMPTIPDGQSWEKNVWTDEYLKALNIKVDVIGVESSSNYDSKIAMMMSSNSLPDIFYVSNAMLRAYVLQDAIQEIGPYQEEFTTEKAKKYLFYDNGIAVNSCFVEGKQYAIPQLRTLYDDQVNNIAIRTDWLENLGIPEPKSWQDILYIIEAFATKDPDMNGKDDTYGMGIDGQSTGGILLGVSDLQGFFNAYGAYPTRWITDANNNIIYGSIQPEVIKPLTVLRDFYKKGYLDPEFDKKTNWDVKEDIINGKIGLSFMVNWGPANFMDLYSTLGDKLKFYPIFSAIEGQKTTIYAKDWMADGAKIVVSKNCKNPEALYKMYSYELEKESETGDEYTRLFESTDSGLIPTKFMIATMGFTPDSAIDNQKEIMSLFTDGKRNDKTPSAKTEKGVARIEKFLNGDRTDRQAWSDYMTAYGNNSTIGVLNYYLDNDMIKLEAFTGTPTTTMLKKSEVLKWETIGAYNYIIMGKEPIEFFDTYVDNWKSKGGDTLITEVNEWWNTQKEK